MVNKKMTYVTDVYVTNVIEPIMMVIPKTETKFLADFQNFIDNLCYKAPEALRSTCWDELLHILEKHLKLIDAEWKMKIVEIIHA